MPTIKINRRTVAAIKPGPKPVLYFDADLAGFGLRVMPSGVAAWIVEYRPGGGGRTAQKKRVKIGRPDDGMPPEQARDAAAKLLAQVRLGADPARAKAEERAGMTLAELVESYLERHVDTKRKSRTAESYRTSLRVHVAPSIGSIRATAVSPADVARMHATGGARGKYAANRALALVSAVYGWAQGAGLVPEGFNPARRVEPFTERQRERFLTTAEINRLGDTLRLAETTGLPYATDPTKAKARNAPRPENRVTVFPTGVTAAIRLLILTGMRLREVLNLEWSQVDVERGIAFLPDSKTGRKPVVLSVAALALLESLPRTGKFVIAGTSAGTAWEKPRADLKRPWAAISTAADIEGVRLHDLRHTFASVGAASGMGLPIIGNLLGHSSPATTARYAHLANDPARRAADSIAATIAGALG